MAPRCHYEVLEIERDSTPDQVRKAYLKMSLRWHPDRNMDNAEEAHVRFQEIAEAHAVLSDPQERAWYDDHRDVILRGGDGTMSEDDGLPHEFLFQYFRATCFSGYGSDDRSFYAVYAAVFARVVEAEMRAKSKHGSSLPPFGSSDSSDDDVRRFYTYFGQFASQRSFAEADKWRPSDGQNRFERRAMEKENAKARKDERLEYNRTVRNLANTVKRRDPRWKRVVAADAEAAARREAELRDRAAREEEMRREAKRKAMERAAIEAEEERQRVAAALAEGADIPPDVAAAMAELVNDATLDRENDFEEDDPVEVVEFYCDVCRKRFKSLKQLSAHEKSKKHRIAMKKIEDQLVQEVTQELDHLNLDELNNLELDNDNDDNIDENIYEDNNDEDNNEDNADNVDNNDEDNADNVDNNDEDNVDNVDNVEEDNPILKEGERRTKTGKVKKARRAARKAGKSKGQTQSQGQSQSQSQGQSQSQTPKRKKGKRREDEEVDVKHTCVKCGKEYPSRGKLFEHLKQSGHAVAL